MTLPQDPRGTLDDDALAGLVRETAASWEMPPVRLDRPGWRDRVRTRRARRIDATRGWLGRLGQAAAAGLVLTVAAAVVGVWLTGPRGAAKGSNEPTGTHPSSTPLPGASLPPKLVLAGDVPDPSNLIVSLESGSAFSIVDLAHGQLSTATASGQYGSTFGRAADGSLYCVCLSGDANQGGIATRVQVALERFDGSMKPTASTPVFEKRGVLDPRPEGRDQNAAVTIRVSPASIPGFAILGWSARAGAPEAPAWHSGLAVLRLSTGKIVSEVSLPDEGIGEGDTGVFVDAPRSVGSVDGKLAIARGRYSWSPIGSEAPTDRFTTDGFLVTIGAQGALETPQPFEAARQCGENLARVGGLPGGRAWLACSSSESGKLILRRVGQDGAVQETRLPTGADLGGETTGVTAVSPDGGSLFSWNPTTLVLTKVDLLTGAVSTVTGTDAAASAGLDPLAALGRWLAPSAAAKMLLSAGIAISPDGSRVYALGADMSGTSGHEVGASRGVFVFDAASLTQTGHWEPTADFVSLAVSPDGRFVYVAGSPGTDATGRQTNQPASITVFDTNDGNVRLLAGQLGQAFMLFPSTVAG